jgi:integrase
VVLYLNSECGWSASYRNWLRSCLRHWCSYREEQSEHPLSLFGVGELRRQRVAHRSERPRSLTLEEGQRLLAAALRHSRSIEQTRNASLILFLYGTGLRGQELCELTLEDLRLEGEAQIRVRSASGQFLRPLSKPARAALDYWLAERNRLSFGVRSSPFLWVTLSANGPKIPGDPIKPQGLRALLARYGALAGIDGVVTPLRVRLTFEAELRGAGVKKRVVRVLLGKKSAGSKVSASECEEAIRRLPQLSALALAEVGD